MESEGGDEATSPRSKMKFLCSHGGKILPRPTDGHLKYVGGETRVVAVPRDISCSELMKKLSTLFDGEMVLKYQIIPEDLDALVSVRSDEDLKHMLDEYDRLESEGTPKLRTFLFPSNLVILENQVPPMEPHAIEQRYIDAINGVVRTTIHSKLSPVIPNHLSFSVSSSCSSPKYSTSPEGNNVDLVPPEHYHFSRLSMHKVQSSPSFHSLNVLPHQISNLTSHQLHQQHLHYYQNHSQYQPHLYLSSRPTQDIPKGVGTDRLSPALSFGRNDIVRSPTGHGLPQYYSLSRQNSGSGSSIKCGCYDEFLAHGSGRLDRVDSVPQSPRKNVW